MENLTIEQLIMLEEYLGKQNIATTQMTIRKLNLNMDANKCEDALFTLYENISDELTARIAME